MDVAEEWELTRDKGTKGEGERDEFSEVDRMISGRLPSGSVARARLRSRSTPWSGRRRSSSRRCLSVNSSRGEVDEEGEEDDEVVVLVGSLKGTSLETNASVREGTFGERGWEASSALRMPRMRLMEAMRLS
jgi:hypothetical protein